MGYKITLSKSNKKKVLNIATEVRGRYILMVDRMLNEFNPEIAEEARKEMDLSISDITADGWYSNKSLRQYLHKVNSDAQRVLGKKMVYAAGEQFDELVSMFEKPADLIKFTIENDPTSNGVFSTG